MSAAPADSMEDKSFFCALDVSDPLPLNPKSRLHIEGWIIPTTGARIDQVVVRVNGTGVRADYPRSRPDVRDYYPQFANAALSGFVTPHVSLPYGADSKLDLQVFARTGETEVKVHE